jgi:peptidoglycan/LPS O-acetylase OafA/YrhL
VKQLAPLTGLRGVAACAVLMAHAIDTSFQYEMGRFHPTAAALAYFGMSLFFVLSGFVIQYNYGASFQSLPLPIATWRFCVARFARLYPLYAVSILTALPSLPTPFPWWVDLSYLTLTQSWFNVEFAMFPPDWSISVEWFFYFLFVPLTFAVTRLRRSPFIILVVLCVAVLGGFDFALGRWQEALTDFARHWFWHGDRLSPPGGWAPLVYFMPYLRVFEFVAGMLAARIYQIKNFDRFAREAVIVGVIWCAGMMAAAIGNVPSLQNVIPNFAFAPGIALVMIGTCQHDGLLARLLSTPTALFLGEISFSIYIWSFVMLTGLGATMSGAQAMPHVFTYIDGGLRVLVLMMATVVMAYGSYLLIEVPSRRWLRKVLLS